MIAKTLCGLPIIDETFGGIFSNRSFLVCGPSKSGKTVLGLRFVQQGLQQNERCLYLSTIMANDLSICAESLGFDMAPHIESGDLTLLEYETFIPGNGAPGLDMLPPEGFDQLREIINANSIERVVLDTVLPWVSVKQPDRMAEQIFSFTRSFDRLGVTTLLTLPKPVSNMSFRLKKSIEDVVPISILLQKEQEEEPATVQVVKYLGEKKLGGKTAYEIATGRERSKEDLEKRIVKEPESTVRSEDLPESKEEPPPPAPGRTKPRAIFSSIQRDPNFSTHSGYSPRQSKPSAEPRTGERDEKNTGGIKSSPPRHSSKFTPPDENSSESSPPEQNTAPPKAARLSSIWKPNSSQDDEELTDA